MFLGPILAWVEGRILRQVLQVTRDHPLVQIGARYDPTLVVAACAAYHHAPGTPGKPPDFTIEQLVRAEIVRTWAEGCSDRDLEFLLQTNLLVRWFVGLSLLASVPDHTTLSRFHAWMRDHAPAAFFRDVYTFLGRVDPEATAATPQIVDTFAMASPVAASPGPAPLLRDLTMGLVRLIRLRGPEGARTALTPLDRTPFTQPPPARTAAQRHERLQTTVALAAQVVTALTPHLPTLAPTLRPLATDYLAAIAKVQTDEPRWIHRCPEPCGSFQSALRRDALNIILASVGDAGSGRGNAGSAMGGA